MNQDKNIDINRNGSETEENKPLRNSFFVRHQRAIFSSLIAAALLVVLVAGYLIFFDGNGSEGPVADAKLRVEAPETSVSGSELSYDIEIENISQVKLTKVRLEIFYPNGFKFIDSIPDRGDNEQFYELSDIDPGETETVSVVGVLEGSAQELKTITVRLRYEPENFRSTFEIEASDSTVVSPPDLTVDLEGPIQIYKGEEVEYNLRIENNSDKIYENLIASFVWPKGLELAEPSDLEIDTSKEDLEFIIENFEPGEVREFSFLAMANFTEPSGIVLEVDLFTLNSDGDRFSAGRTFLFVEVLPPPLDLQHSVRTSFNQNTTLLEAGQELVYTVSFENTGSLPLKNVNLIFNYDPAILDLSASNNFDGGQKSADTIRWIPAATPELRDVVPGRKGEFTFEVRVRNGLAQQGYTNPVNITSVSYVSEQFSEEISGNRIEQKIQSDFDISVQSTEISADGQSPRYRIEVSTTNTVNDLSNAVFSARMPGIDTKIDETTVNSPEKSRVEIDESSGLLKWNLGHVPALTGFTRPVRRLTFEIESDSDVILNEIEASGQDEFVGERIDAGRIDPVRAQ